MSFQCDDANRQDRWRRFRNERFVLSHCLHDNSTFSFVHQLSKDIRIPRGCRRDRALLNIEKCLAQRTKDFSFSVLIDCIKQGERDQCYLREKRNFKRPITSGGRVEIRRIVHCLVSLNEWLSSVELLRSLNERESKHRNGDVMLSSVIMLH